MSANAMSAEVPKWLGRGVIVNAGEAAPTGFEGLERLIVDSHALSTPKPLADTMCRYWLARIPFIVELAVEADELRVEPIETREPYLLSAGFEFSIERLGYFVWSNNFDFRSGELVWWWSRKAKRIFGDRVTLQAETGQPVVGDLMFDGQAVWCDGGPRQAYQPEVLGSCKVLHRDAIEAGVGELDCAVNPLVPDGPHQLAADQLAAVNHDRGAARIIAPAGSGKTRVLTSRLRHLLQDRNWNPDSVLAVAYNKRAAEEMRERTAGSRANVMTLNALGMAICNGSNGFGSTSDGTKPRAVITEREQRKIIDSLIKVPRVANGDPLANYLDGLRDIRLGLQEPTKVETALEAEGLADLFPRYLRVLEDRNLIDFDGQLYEAIRLLLTNPLARRNAQLRTRHMLVDEFQDLTAAHLLLVRLLSAPTYDVFGVGDDDQVIYGYSGASPRFLIDFSDYFPGASAYGLSSNYRCPAKVVEAAGTLLSYNSVRIEKSITAARPSDDRSSIKATLVPQVESALACFEALKAFTEGSAVVLSRVNSVLLPVQVLLTQEQVPCKAPLDEYVLERTGMRAALAWIRVALNPHEISRSDLLETVRRPSRRIARNVTEMMSKQHTTSVASLRRLAGALSGRDVEKILAYVADVEMLSAIAKSSPTVELLRAIRNKVGLDDSVDVLDRGRREADRSTHVDDLVALEQVATLHDNPGGFEPWLRDCLRNRPNSDHGVELSTIHRVKGREWSNVIVFGCDNSLMPHRLASDISEERRLFHVAITRASDNVVLVGDQANPSMFIAEMHGKAPRKPPPSQRIAEQRRAATTSPKPADQTDLDPAGQRLLDALTAWRKQTASEEGVPAYVILSNADARNLAASAPRDLKALAGCRGMGATRIERWGDEILSVIEEVVT